MASCRDFSSSVGSLQMSVCGMPSPAPTYEGAVFRACRESRRRRRSARTRTKRSWRYRPRCPARQRSTIRPIESPNFWELPMLPWFASAYIPAWLGAYDAIPMLLSPARGRGWVRGMRTSLPPHLASPPGGERNMKMSRHRSSYAGEEASTSGCQCPGRKAHASTNRPTSPCARWSTTWRSCHLRSDGRWPIDTMVASGRCCFRAS